MGSVRLGDHALSALAAVLVSTFAGVTGSAKADSSVVDLPVATPISGYGRALAWSTFDAADKRFRLMAMVDGKTVAVRVRPREVPFDVDLGPDAHGDLVAVYSRCRSEDNPSVGDPRAQFVPSVATGCVLWRYDFASKRETRLRGVARRGSSEYLPAIWKDTVAFASAKPGEREHVYRADIGRRPHVRRVRETWLQRQPDAVRAMHWGIRKLDLFGRRLALQRWWDDRTAVWSLTGDEAGAPVLDVGGYGATTYQAAGVAVTRTTLIAGLAKDEYGTLSAQISRLSGAGRTPQLSSAAPFARPILVDVALLGSSVYYAANHACDPAPTPCVDGGIYKLGS